MLFTNPCATRAPYPAELRALLCMARARESRRWLAHWPRIARTATPLRDLPDLAADLRIARFGVKDESARSPLGSFKVLGAPVALVREIARRHPDVDPARVLLGHTADRLAGFTVISATDGNHGRALAAAAHDAGCQCVIVLHAEVEAEREQAIAVHGARLVRIAGDYDESVREAARLAATNGWQVVSDTSYPGYEVVPRDVMQGYGIIAAEVIEQVSARPGEAWDFSHVFLQGGVGGLAAGIVSYLWEYQGLRRPHTVVVEPRQADCLLQSAIRGRASRASGSVGSVMAGLACGEASPLAWKFLETGVDHFMTVDDEQAVAAMRVLARGSDRDVPIVAGESGVAGLAALRALRRDAALSEEAGLDVNSRVLIINTEGDTAPAMYARLAGESGDSVRTRQGAWLRASRRS